jgi:hypothetical protein
MNRKILGAAFLGFLVLKVVSRHHPMGGGHGPMGRHGRRLDVNDPRRQWVREFHRSLHEADEAEAAGATAGTAGDAATTTNPATAD